MSFRSRRTVSRSKNSSDRKLRIESLEGRSLLAADFDLIGEFVANPQDRGSNPDFIGELNGSLIFTSDFKIWSSDGTASGTSELLDFQSASGVEAAAGHAFMDDSIYFLVRTLRSTPGDTYDDILFYETIWSWELWRSDGTTIGTEQIYSEEMYDYSSHVISDLTALNGQLYFIAQGVVWTSDGTSAGTNPFSYGAVYHGIQSVSELTDVNDKLFFAGRGSSSASSGLWMYDSAGRESYLLATEPNGYLYPENLTRVGSSIFFTARNSNSGRELWRSDGTAAGTFRVKDINPGEANSYSGLLTNVGGTLFFSATDGVGGGELWKSDGTEAGTVRVKDIHDGGAGAYLHGMVDVGGTLYFSANDGVSGSELWKSDGSEAGTVRIADIFPGAQGSTPFNLTNVNGIAYFSAKNDATDRELWRSDGTATGTYLVSDILPGPEGSNPSGLTNFGGRLFFAAAGRVMDSEPWISDGTREGTRQVKDVYNHDLGWRRKELFEFNGELFFSARLNPSSMFDDELWKSDGTVGGTALLKEFNPGWFGANPTEFTVLGGSLYFKVFVGDYSVYGLKSYQLWRTEGTAAGSVALQTGLPTLTELTPIDDAIYFVGGGETAPGELWKSDGTTAGTVQLKDIRSGATSSSPRFLTGVGGRLFFTANDGLTGEELWVSDGTEAGTQLVKDIVTGLNGSSLGNLTEMGGAVYFTANEGSSGVELWKSDGTAAGTTRVKDIASGVGSSTPSQLINVGGMLYFTANDGIAGEELWRSDGTEAGTTRVRDIRPGNAGSTPTQLIDVAGTLYVVADDGVAGLELWASDGTEAGTRLVSDLRPGAGDSKPVNLTNISGQLYFHANDGSQGVELWSSDGSAAGMELIADFDASVGTGLGSLNGRLVVVTLNDAFREQLWIADIALPAPQGDYDANGIVDGSDFLAWQRGFGSAASPAGSGADGDGDGAIDAGDLGVWAEHFGEGAGEAAGATAMSVGAMSVATVEADPVGAEVAAAGRFVAQPRAAGGADLVALAQGAFGVGDGGGDAGDRWAAEQMIRSDDAEEVPPVRRRVATSRDAAFAALAEWPVASVFGLRGAGDFEQGDEFSELGAVLDSSLHSE